MLPPLEILGIASALVTLSCFVLNQYKRVSTDSVWYDLANGLSGLGLMAYAFSIHAIPFMLTNTVWAVVSLSDVAKYLLRKRAK
jgi:hypothetical protein